MDGGIERASERGKGGEGGYGARSSDKNGDTGWYGCLELASDNSIRNDNRISVTCFLCKGH